MRFFRTVFSLCVSFYSYREVRDLPVGSSIKYLLQLMTLLALVLTISFIPVARQGADSLATRFDAGRPAFSIKDGHVVTAVTNAQYWGGDGLRFGLVPSGQTTQIETQAIYGIVFSGDHFVFWTAVTNVTPPVVRTVENKLRGLPDGEVTGNYFRQLMRVSLPVMLPVGWMALTLIGTVGGLLQAGTFSAVGSLMERSMQRPLSFTQLLNVTIHAITPAAILVTAYRAMQLPGLDLWLVYLIAFGVFLLGATNACRGDHPPELPADH